MQQMELEGPAPWNMQSLNNDTSGKCNVVGCMQPAEDAQPCHQCPKLVHQACCTRAVFCKFQVSPLTDPVNKQQIFVCSKTCYNKVEKKIVLLPSSRIPWDSDGRLGPSDPCNSMKILLDWILEHGNYMKFCGHGNKGTAKLQYGQLISDKIKEAGLRVERSAEAVVKKIQDLEGKFTRSHYWANSTGQEVKERDGNQTFECLLRQRCKYYFELLPIMKDRGKVPPAVTTDNTDAISIYSEISCNVPPGDPSVVPKIVSKQKGKKPLPSTASTSSSLPKRSSKTFEDSMLELMWSKEKRKNIAQRVQWLFQMKELQKQGYSKETILRIVPELQPALSKRRKMNNELDNDTDFDNNNHKGDSDMDSI